MSIIRKPRPETKYYVLDKNISEDKRLSWNARGMLVFLLGKPDNWEVSVQHLINETQHALGKVSGRDAVRGILKELEKAGYLTVDRSRSEGGAFAGMAYTVSEQPTMAPQTENPGVGAPQTENPAPANPATDNPAPANPPLIKNDFKQLPEDATKTEVSEVPPAAPSTPGQGVVPVLDIPRVVIAEDMPGPRDASCVTYKAWTNYAYAYRSRYHEWPVWNAKVAGQVASLVKRLGIEVAHHVAAFYVKIDDAYLIKDCHSLNRLLAGCEAYHTQWKTNRPVNGTTAQQMERKQANRTAAQDAAAMFTTGTGSQTNEFL
jgi:hypothetical protein